MAADVAKAPTVGGFLFATLAAIGAGLALSTVRWAVLDRIHNVTGLAQRGRTPSLTSAELAAYRITVDFHYRYYQFYGSTFVTLAGLMLVPPSDELGKLTTTPIGRLSLLAALAVCFAASRDTLEKCYLRGPAAGSTTPDSDSRKTIMTNGGHYGASKRAVERDHEFMGEPAESRPAEHRSEVELPLADSDKEPAPPLNQQEKRE
ncbi:MAG: hypothetical protein CMJ58_25705 [Planctomycetaceae bacterium]|nr:hypothetical protein [Planctomycetaceae bacterium]